MGLVAELDVIILAKEDFCIILWHGLKCGVGALGVKEGGDWWQLRVMESKKNVRKIEMRTKDKKTKVDK